MSKLIDNIFKFHIKEISHFELLVINAVGFTEDVFEKEIWKVIIDYFAV